MTETKAQAVVETEATEDILDKVRKLLAKAEHIAQMASPDPNLVREAEALNLRAATLIAKYRIDRAMLAADGKQGDAIIDEVVMVTRPFSSKFMDLLWAVAGPMNAQARTIKRFDENAHGGRSKGVWQYGLRIFAYESDMAMIKLLYTSARNQALSGVSKIVDRTSEFGQTQKADRESYLDGFVTGVWSQITATQKAAQQAREAEEEELRDRAMLTGVISTSPSQTGVALVLADRKKAVAVAMDLANGITVQDRARWAKQGEESSKRYEARRQEQRDCEKCQQAKSGYCSRHRSMRPTMGRASYERVGNQWSAGYSDGQRADLGTSKTQVGGRGRTAIS